jgi:molybdopterin biosynthesis enzyme MoaB
MVQYPIYVPRKSYKGSKQNLQMKNIQNNLIAAELEKVVNEIIKDSNENIVSVLYCEISSKTGYSIEEIRELLQWINCL